MGNNSKIMQKGTVSRRKRWSAISGAGLSIGYQRAAGPGAPFIIRRGRELPDSAAENLIHATCGSRSPARRRIAECDDQLHALQPARAVGLHILCLQRYVRALHLDHAGGLNRD